ncbi:MAG: sarcosine oxidase subunit delta [Qingshengfaniella sp.]
MQKFPCPFCGFRNETEFHFVAEAGKVRPDTSGTVETHDWASYLFDQSNGCGPVREVWTHLPCAEMFILHRDSVTMKVTGSTALRKDAE